LPARAENTDGQVAETVLKELEAEPDRGKPAARWMERARQALGRARGAGDAGDHRHAAELQALARELAETGRDLIRALRAERESTELARRAALAETRAIRAQALVEQTAARRGRAAAQLAALEAERSANAAALPAKPAPAPAPGAPSNEATPKPSAPKSVPAGAGRPSEKSPSTGARR